MINGAHLLLYSTDADADRAFLRDVLQFRSVDVGRGWLIFALPPSELAVHPIEDAEGRKRAAGEMLGAELYLMCDDVRATVKALETKHVKCAALAEEPWGIRTSIPLPSGGRIGLYQPTHPTATTLR
jgi:hypothetical protein